MSKKAKLILIICLAAACAVALTLTLALTVKCDGGEEKPSIGVTVNGEVQENGGTVQATVGTACILAAAADGGAPVQIVYSFEGGFAQAFTGAAFIPAQEGTYTFNFTAEGSEMFVLRFAAAASGESGTQVTVSFSLGAHTEAGEELPAPQQVAVGSAIYLPAAPQAAEGYTFLGWFDGTNTYPAGAAYTVRSAVTITALWEAETYTLTFALGEHAAAGVQPVAPIEAEHGEVVSLPAPVQAESGYTFLGWNNGSATYGGGEEYAVTEDAAFTAVWQEQGAGPATYTVRFSLGSYAAEGESAPAEQQMAAGSAFNLPAAPQAAEGYTFLGWYDGTTLYQAGAAYTVNGSVTLTARWQASLCTVSYSGGAHAAADAQLPASQQLSKGSGFYLPEGPAAAEGYTFVGWNDGSKTYTQGEAYIVTGSVTLTAQWQAAQYTVSFAKGDHAADNAQLPSSLQKTYGDTFELPAAIAAEEGYLFAGWYDGEETYAAGASYTVYGAVTFVAVWESSGLPSSEYLIQNGGFETGDLTGWTYQNGTENGEILGDQAVISDTYFWAQRVPYNQSGNYHFDGWSAKDDQNEQHTYTLRSTEFTLGGSGYISFKMAGNAACVMVYTAEENRLIAQYRNTVFHDIQNVTDLDTGSRLATLTTFVANLEEYVGERLYIMLCDTSASAWAVAFFDEIVTYYKTPPAVTGSYDTVQFYRGGYQEGGANELVTYQIPWVSATNVVADSETYGENVLSLSFDGTGYQEVNENGSGAVATVNGVLNNPVFQDSPVPLYRPNGIDGTALSFDGYSQYLSFDGDPSGNALTIDVYVCPRAFTWSAPQDPAEKHFAHVIVGSFDSNAKKGFMLGVTKFGYPTFRVGTGSDWYIISFSNQAQYQLKNYEWARLTAVFDGINGRISLYINGIEAKTLNIPGGVSIQSAGKPILVGASSEAEYVARFEKTKFNGLMDELTVQKAALTKAQIEETGKALPSIDYNTARIPDYVFENDWYRPQYHAVPPANWMNEPHALFQYNGKWHLFYQYNPIGPYWHNICWGHWVSDDMVQWEYVKEAVIPTEGTIAPDGIWTGNVVFDDQGRPVLLITAGDDNRPNGSTQHVGLAYAKDYSDPYLTEWYIGDYAVKQTSAMGTVGEFRDAQAFGIGNDRYMVVGGQIGGRGAAHVFKTTANNLTNWQYMGNLFTPANYKQEYGTVWEMPNIVPLPYENGQLSGKYLFVFSPQHGDNDVWYYIGNFDTNSCRFTADFADAKLMDFGNNVFTGPTVYSDPSTNRVYICSIMQAQRSEEDRYNAGWAFQAGLPRELFLRSDGTLGIKHIDTSSAEGHTIVSFSNLSAGDANSRLSVVSSDLIKIDFTITNARGSVGLRLKNGEGYAELYFTDDRAGINTNPITNGYQRTKGDFFGEYRRQNGTITGTVYIDKCLIEAYFGNAATISACVYGRGKGLQVFGDATFSVAVTAMNSIH